jgi:hypothetical protein
VRQASVMVERPLLYPGMTPVQLTILKAGNMKTIQEFIDSRGITMTVERAKSNPNITNDEWSTRHWKCMLRYGNKEMFVYFSQGSAHTQEPTTAEVLDCLASDASSFENTDGFESWANEFGYDTDSRKAERIYKVVEEQADKLARLISPDDYETLLWDTERL